MVFSRLGLATISRFGRLCFVNWTQQREKLQGRCVARNLQTFISFLIALGGYSGQAGMIWPPVYGVVLGMLTYSIMFATIVRLTSGRLL